MALRPKRQYHRKSSDIRSDSLGSSGHHEGHAHRGKNFDSLTYVTDESDAWRAHVATSHYLHRGQFWNAGKHATLMRYILIATVGIAQAAVAYFTNITSNWFITVSTTQMKERYTSLDMLF
jgi:hypothetical protein